MPSDLQWHEKKRFMGLALLSGPCIGISLSFKGQAIAAAGGRAKWVHNDCSTNEATMMTS